MFASGNVFEGWEWASSLDLQITVNWLVGTRPKSDFAHLHYQASVHRGDTLSCMHAHTYHIQLIMKNRTSVKTQLQHEAINHSDVQQWNHTLNCFILSQLWNYMRVWGRGERNKRNGKEKRRRGWQQWWQVNREIKIAITYTLMFIFNHYNLNTLHYKAAVELKMLKAETKKKSLRLNCECELCVFVCIPESHIRSLVTADPLQCLWPTLRVCKVLTFSRKHTNPPID